MPVSLIDVNVSEVPTNGGYLIEVRGVFERGRTVHMHVGPNGDATDPACRSGTSGAGINLLPVNEGLLIGYTPVVPVGLASVYVVQTATADDDVLVDVLTVVEPVYVNSVHDIRRVLPLEFLVGPRGMQELHLPGVVKSFPVGVLEAVTSVIGEADGNIGGLFQTRLTAAVAAGAVSLPVESTYGFAESGRVGLQGVVYFYASKTLTSFDGITHVFGGATVIGTRLDHREEAVVADLNQGRSAIELARQAMLVEYAEGEYLNTLGRNLGVGRLPFLKSDDQFREIVKHLAYNPRGTYFGIELALVGLVGAGNFEIVEDLIRHPNTVFIRLIGAATTEDISYGKAYTEGAELQPATSNTTVEIDEEPITRGVVSSVRLKDEDHRTETQTQYPSTETIQEYPGGPTVPVWVLEGTAAEGAQILLQTTDGGRINFAAPPTTYGIYRHDARVQPESYAEMALLMHMRTGTGLETTIVNGMRILDGERNIGVGIRTANLSEFWIGLAQMAPGVTNWLTGPAITLPRGTPYHTVRVKKFGRGRVELWVNGNLVQTAQVTDFLTTSSEQFDFGVYRNTGTADMCVREVDFYAETLTDYWSARGDSADVNSGDPDRIDTNAGIFVVGDVGKQLITRNSQIDNGYGGNNNGEWEVAAFVDADNVDVIGPTRLNATLQSAFPQRVAIPTTERQFRFPDDLGKEIEIIGSTVGNDGVYRIVQLLEPGTFNDLAAGATPVPTTTNIAVVDDGFGGPTFNTEAGVQWRLLPSFATEANLEWELAEAGSRSGTTLTLRQALPVYPAVLEVRYSELLTAQMLRDVNVQNEVIQEVPDLLFAYYPFYLADPLGFVRTYLDDVTAAGVIPDYEIV